MPPHVKDWHNANTRFVQFQLEKTLDASPVQMSMKNQLFFMHESNRL